MFDFTFTFLMCGVVQLNVTQFADPVDQMADMVDRCEFVDLLKHMLELDQDRRVRPSDALGHRFLLLSHLVDYASSHL